MFAQAKERANGKPDYVITDGLQAYRDAFNKEYWTMKGPRTQHVRLPSIRKEANNNMVERLQGTVRERDKVMRALDNAESAPQIIEGMQLYHNFIRPHMALQGKTPAEAAGINLDLIKRSVEAKSRKLTVTAPMGQVPKSQHNHTWKALLGSSIICS